MAVETTQMSENGGIVIPASYRKAMGLKGGEVLTIRMDEEGLHLQSRAQAIKRSQAVVRQHVPEGASRVDELIAERESEGKREVAEMGGRAVRRSFGHSTLYGSMLRAKKGWWRSFCANAAKSP